MPEVITGMPLRPMPKQSLNSLVENNQFPKSEGIWYPLELGKMLYDQVMDKQPDVIIEFGTGDGFMTLCMACALKRIGKGEIYTYDFFDPNATRLVDLTNQYMKMGREIERLGVEDHIVCGFKDFYKWIETADVTESFDMLYVDVGTTGNTVSLLKENLTKSLKRGATVLFEGGGTERDTFTKKGRGSAGYWGRCVNHSNIGDLKDELGFTVLSNTIPSLSKFKNE